MHEPEAQPESVFLASEFLAAGFEPRAMTLSEEIEDLAPYFKGPARWRLRGLTYLERLRAQTLAAIQVQAISKKDLLEDRLERAVMERCAYLVAASIQPVIDIALARKLSDVYPVEFEVLSNVAIQLTGQGQQAISADG